MASTEGRIDFTVNGKTYQTWYKIFGDIRSGKVPVVALHGGPGAGHSYPHNRLWEQAKIPVILYDQLGTGNSSHVPDVPKEFWTPDLFMDELTNLLHHFKIHDKFDLLGVSWGGMLAGNYAAARQPKGLRKLVIASSPANNDLYMKGINELLDASFPLEFVAMLRKHEAEGTFDSPEYVAGNTLFMKRFTCSVDPWPETLEATMKTMEEDPTVYQAMQGPTEFCMSGGTLQNWDIIPILPNITSPTLLLRGKNDSVSAESMYPFFNNIRQVKWVELEKSTHLGMYEEPDR
ncbi:hypothetical protein CVT24_013064 [Panaeolus cyanescens]|uniref:AB hydrolase-1 domain-containing protein n=1 Tax=Panaeolus cyanescens TaxID=181874 RepID=A0A409YUR1_9AGAR|nr:hypothetical protein CVT24_013064 [Panaeolus cyanescens]